MSATTFGFTMATSLLIFRMTLYFIIPRVITVPDNHLWMITPVTSVPNPVVVEIPVCSWTVYNDLIPWIQIIVSIARRQWIGIYPPATRQINKLSRGNIVICFHIGQIIIFHIIIAYRSPYRLRSDIEIHIDPYLCCGLLNRKRRYEQNRTND